ncbi:hypothetical protein ACFY3G_14895 [Streptomyces phaeochromogenes]|uniref:hypothetical protein n=1 Tax=Streptomyces phaeochromogenes TaxID=1923 RepID=UPI0036C8A2E4
MTAQTLTPAGEAFVALADHCIECPGCKVDLDRPDETPECPAAEALYRAWFIIWREEVRR